MSPLTELSVLLGVVSEFFRESDGKPGLPSPAGGFPTLSGQLPEGRFQNLGLSFQPRPSSGGQEGQWGLRQLSLRAWEPASDRGAGTGSLKKKKQKINHQRFFS